MSDESLAVWREVVREFQEWCVAHGASSILVSWPTTPEAKAMQILVHADGRAVAITPEGRLDLATEEGLLELASHTDVPPKDQPA